MVYSFYFLCVGTTWNEWNSFWGEKKRGGEVRRLWLIPMLFLLCWTFFQVSLMIRWYRNLSLYITILSLYCRNISFFSDEISFRVSSRLLISPPPLIPPKTIEFIPYGTNTQKIKRIDHCKYNVRASKNAEQAFSTQWYLYICNGLFFLFSSVP